MKTAREELQQIITQKNIIKDGHFILSSGLHSTKYVDKNLLFTYPDLLRAFAETLLDQMQDNAWDVVWGISPNASIFAHYVAQLLDCLVGYVERDRYGNLTHRPSFDRLLSYERVLLVEDVVTTGATTDEVLAYLYNQGAIVQHVGSMIDRSNMTYLQDKELSYSSVLPLELSQVSAEWCTQCALGTPVHPTLGHRSN